MEEDLFVKAPVSKAYFKFTLPLVCSLIVGLIYNMVDTYFIGHTGDANQVAAVSLCGPIFGAVNAIGGILSIGGSTAISRLFGEKNDEKAKSIGSFCFYGLLLIGFIVSAFMLMFSNSILKILGVDEMTFKFALSYYRYIALGVPFIMFSAGAPSILRSEGLTKEVMFGSILGTVLNIILDPIFIIWMNRGAAGAAIGTVIANILTDVFCVYIILKKSRKFSLSIKRCSIDFNTLKNILAIGIPGSLQSAMQSFTIVVINVSLYVYGNNEIASMGIAMKLIMIIVMIIVGFSFGMQPLIGYNYGAKNVKRLKEILRFSLIFEIALTTVMSAILFIGANPIMRCFIDNDNVVASGSTILRLQVITIPLLTIIFICTVVFQAAGKAVSALILSLSHQGILFVPVILILKSAFGYYGVICAQPVTDVLTVILTIVLFYITFNQLFRNENNNAINSSDANYN